MPIFKRVSCRDFCDYKVTDKEIELILRAGMQAPSAVNQQPWRFLVCDDVAVIREFSEICPNARSLKTATLVLVLYYCETAPHASFVMQDMGACAENCLLEIADLNLGGVWIGIAPKEERMVLVENTFGTTDGYRPFCLIAIGKPKENKRQVSRFDASKVMYFKRKD